MWHPSSQGSTCRGIRVAGTPVIAAPGASYAVDFSQLMKNAELLPPAAADRAAGKIDEASRRRESETKTTNCPRKRVNSTPAAAARPRGLSRADSRDRAPRARRLVVAASVRRLVRGRTSALRRERHAGGAHACAWRQVRQLLAVPGFERLAYGAVRSLPGQGGHGRRLVQLLALEVFVSHCGSRAAMDDDIPVIVGVRVKCASCGHTEDETYGSDQ
jgi:hypothetical protein